MHAADISQCDGVHDRGLGGVWTRGKQLQQRMCMFRPALRSHPGSVRSAGLWSLDNPQDPQTQCILREADMQPDDYVLKPQREGGGNNLYGDQLQQRLRDPKGLAAYILMQRIRPPINRYPSCLSSQPAATVRAKHAS